MYRHRLVIILVAAAAVLAGLTLLIGSVASGRGQPSVPILKSRPRITGVPQVGHILHAHPGRWSAASGFTYRWQLCTARGAHCRPIYGARHRLYSNPAYKLVSRDAGHRIRLVVIARNHQGDRTARSHLTAIITKTGSTSPVTPTSPSAPTPATGTRQSVTFWLGWVTNASLSQIPWNAVTQVDLFSLASCVSAGQPYHDCAGPASIDTQLNSINNINVPQWVGTVHQNHRLALISIGGSTNPDWHYPCSSANVAAFAHNLVSYMQSNGFDGIDLDIEQDPGSSNSGFSTAELTACAQNVYNDAKAIRTAAGNTPLVTADVDPTTSLDIGADEKPYVDQFNSMGYGHNTAAQLQADLAALKNGSGIPESKVTLGIDVGSSTPADCGNIANYAKAASTAGTMVWFLQGDKNYACLGQIAPYVAPPTP